MTRERAPNRLLITIAVMLATLMNSLDITIANVALPHIQGSVSAGPEQISWVLTSYIVAAAIMTPLSGWLSDRVGRKQLFLVSIGSFVVASILCGLATGLPELVIFRLFQGLFGAALIPLSQAILLDTYPPRLHGQAMAIWTAGAIVGPILGPALGGFLTENYSWRWCFFINLPVGILAVAGVWLFVPGQAKRRAAPFDFLGFGALALFVASLQLVLDRGPTEDWYGSREIWIETILAAIGLWVFLAHTFLAPRSFFNLRLARDRNFVVASVFGFFVSILLFSSMALLPPMMQENMGYPVLTAGLVTMPRGLGSLAAVLIISRFTGRIDTRLILVAGLMFCGVGFWQMSHFDLSMSPRAIIVSGIVQGFGIGLLFAPLAALAFATLPADLRGEASAFNSLVRNLGASIGISVMQALIVSNTQTMHASLAAKVIPSDPIVGRGAPTRFDLASTEGLAALNAEITRQASMVAYVDDFKLMLIITMLCAPLLLFLRRPRQGAGEAVNVAVE
jgi:DHA2 family multidrug resistance protein